MKTANLGQILKWNGLLYEVISINDGQKSIGLRSIQPTFCKHCGGKLEHDFVDVVESSPLFQETAEPVETIEVSS